MYLCPKNNFVKQIVKDFLTKEELRRNCFWFWPRWENSTTEATWHWRRHWHVWFPPFGVSLLSNLWRGRWKNDGQCATYASVRKNTTNRNWKGRYKLNERKIGKAPRRINLRHFPYEWRKWTSQNFEIEYFWWVYLGFLSEYPKLQDQTWATRV